MLTKLFVPSFFCILISFTVVARDFPGYYIKTNGDTVNCNFQFNDREITPEFITVKDGNSTAKLYPVDILGFGINGYGEYKSYEINYHKGNYTSHEAPDTFNDSVYTKYSFVKVLLTGKYSLYELRESYRAYYFISEDGGTLHELVYRVKRVDMNLEEDNTYKRTIFELFAKEHISYEYSNHINKSIYSTRDIIPLILKLNEKNSGVKIKRKKQRLLQMDVFIGGIYNQFPTPVDGRYSDPSNTFEGSSTISGGLNLQYFVPSNFRRIAIGLSAGFNQYDTELYRDDSIGYYGSANYYYWTKYNEHFTMKNKVIMIDVYGIYIVNPQNKVKLYLKGGFNTNISIEKSNQIQIDYTSTNRSVRNGNPSQDGTDQGMKTIPINKTYYNLHGGAGINFNNHKLEFTYYTPGVLNTDYLFKIMMMGVYYGYTIFK